MGKPRQMLSNSFRTSSASQTKLRWKVGMRSRPDVACLTSSGISKVAGFGRRSCPRVPSPPNSPLLTRDFAPTVTLRQFCHGVSLSSIDQHASNDHSGGAYSLGYPAGCCPGRQAGYVLQRRHPGSKVAVGRTTRDRGRLRPCRPGDQRLAAPRRSAWQFGQQGRPARTPGPGPEARARTERRDESDGARAETRAGAGRCSRPAAFDALVTNAWPVPGSRRGNSGSKAGSRGRQNRNQDRGEGRVPWVPPPAAVATPRAPGKLRPTNKALRSGGRTARHERPACHLGWSPTAMRVHYGEHEDAVATAHRADAVSRRGCVLPAWPAPAARAGGLRSVKAAVRCVPWAGPSASSFLASG
jgi:hypothetical protein